MKTLGEVLEKKGVTLDNIWSYNVYSPLSLDDIAEVRIVIQRGTHQPEGLPEEYYIPVN